MARFIGTFRCRDAGKPLAERAIPSNITHWRAGRLVPPAAGSRLPADDEGGEVVVGTLPPGEYRLQRDESTDEVHVVKMAANARAAAGLPEVEVAGEGRGRDRMPATLRAMNRLKDEFWAKRSAS